MEIVNLKISKVYSKLLYGAGNVIEIKLDAVKSPIGTRAMFKKGEKVINKKGEFVNIEDLKEGDVIRAVIGV